MKLHNKLFCLIVLGLQISGAWAASNLSEIKDINTILPVIDQQTLVVLDLDRTLLVGSSTDYGTAEWFYCEYQQAMSEGVSKKVFFDSFYPIWTRSQSVTTPMVTQEGLTDTMGNLKEQAFDVIGLTSRQPVVKDATLKQLEVLNLRFAQGPASRIYELEYPAVFQDGVIFAHDLNPKGAVFKQWWLDYQKANPNSHQISKVVFVDDGKHHVEGMAKTIEALGLDYEGFHYTGYENTEFDCKRARLQAEVVERAFALRSGAS